MTTVRLTSSRLVSRFTNYFLADPLDLAQSLFENFTRVHYETSGTGRQEKLAVQQSCSLSDLE